jgi:hypothetical protein
MGGFYARSRRINRIRVKKVEDNIHNTLLNSYFLLFNDKECSRYIDTAAIGITPMAINNAAAPAVNHPVRENIKVKRQKKMFRKKPTATCATKISVPSILDKNCLNFISRLFGKAQSYKF